MKNTLWKRDILESNIDFYNIVIYPSTVNYRTLWYIKHLMMLGQKVKNIFFFISEQHSSCSFPLYFRCIYYRGRQQLCSEYLLVLILIIAEWSRHKKTNLQKWNRIQCTVDQSQFLQYCQWPGGAAGEPWVTVTITSPWMFSLYHVTYFLIIKWARLEEDASLQIFYFCKSLPPSFIRPLTNKLAFWINQQDRLIWCQRKYNWVKITPSCSNLINISNSCLEELDIWRIQKRRKNCSSFCLFWHLALVLVKFECITSHIGQKNWM